MRTIYAGMKCVNIYLQFPNVYKFGNYVCEFNSTEI
ncbi:hypothetical protein F383_36133 [Gossypium arboreum]|uniref:Uncharacterized protein n=1 Tax=Gossypium arboreum TaxID=29729 RepID=A0A0B0N7Q4_GOSAR|nr:hypothetical protein F383_36133 [Gossypium arboreum]